MQETVDWELTVLNDPDGAREWLRKEGGEGIAYLMADGAVHSLRGGPTATACLLLHVVSGCLFTMIANYRGMLVALRETTGDTVAFVASLDHAAQDDLESWMPTQEWRYLAKLEIPLGPWRGAMERRDKAEDSQPDSNPLSDVLDEQSSVRRDTMNHGPIDRWAVPVDPRLPSGRQLSPRDAKTLAHRDLRAAFPGVKFNITSRHRGSSGASMVVYWQDGPEEDEVKALLDKYRGYFRDYQYNPEDYWPRETVVDGKRVWSDLKYIFLNRSTPR